MKKLIFIVMMGASCAVRADVYKCTDENGRSAYQERPCETAKLKPAGVVKKPVDIPLEEQQRRISGAEKSKARLDAAMDAREKTEIAEQEKRDANFRRELDARNVAAQERQAVAAEQAARKPTVQINVR